MTRSRWIVLVALATLVVSCGGGGGGGKKRPFPKAVKQLFDPLIGDFKDGPPNINVTLSCGAPIANPFAVLSKSNSVLVDQTTAHAGTVLQATYQITEVRGSKGGGEITIQVVDANDPQRVFLEIVGKFNPPTIKFLPPPLGSKQFLAPDGTGQAFALLRYERKIKWTRTWTNDPTGTGTGTLVNFSGPPAISPAASGTRKGETVEEHTYLVEFDVIAGPPTNSACVADIDRVGSVVVTNYDGSATTIDPIVHDDDVIVDTLTGPYRARRNKHARLVPIGTDADPAGIVADGDNLNITSGVITDGVVGFPSPNNESDVDDAGGAMIIVNDGVPPIDDGDFGGIINYDLDLVFDVNNAFPGQLGDGIVQASILRVKTSQEQDPANDSMDHPVLNGQEMLFEGEFLLYLEYEAETETGLIIYR